MLLSNPEAIGSLELPADTKVESPVLCEIPAGHFESKRSHRSCNDDTGTHRHTGSVLVEQESGFAWNILLIIKIVAEE